MDRIAKYSEQTFEGIKHIDEAREEYWFARELQNALEYTEWRNFHKVIESAMLACENSGYKAKSHFVDVNKMVEMPTKSTKKTSDFGFVDVNKTKMKAIPDYRLSRFACYLIVMNGDPRKEVIAVGQTYFAVKTRQHELIENYEQLTEDKKRLEIRNQMAIHNKSLAQSAKMAGVDNYGLFQNKGYQGLYGGLGAKQIRANKGLKDGQEILDYMGSTELAANLFRTTQTDEKLRRENIQGTLAASQAHYEVGTKVRRTIQEIGGTMPENLPTPEKSIKQIEQEAKKLAKGDNGAGGKSLPTG